MSVAISGNWYIVGDPAKFSDKWGGSAIVRYVDSTKPDADLTPDDLKPGDGFGYNVSISNDVAIVGAPGTHRDGRPNVGSAFVYYLSGDTWTESTKLLPRDGGSDDYSFGCVEP